MLISYKTQELHRDTREHTFKDNLISQNIVTRPQSPPPAYTTAVPPPSTPPVFSVTVNEVPSTAFYLAPPPRSPRYLSEAHPSGDHQSLPNNLTQETPSSSFSLSDRATPIIIASGDTLRPRRRSQHLNESAILIRPERYTPDTHEDAAHYPESLPHYDTENIFTQTTGAIRLNQQEEAESSPAGISADISQDSLSLTDTPSTQPPVERLYSGSPETIIPVPDDSLNFGMILDGRPPQTSASRDQSTDSPTNPNDINHVFPDYNARSE